MAAPLHYAFIGPPSALTAWAFEVATALAGLDKQVTVRRIDRADALTEAADTRVLYLTNFPCAALIEGMSAGRIAGVYLVEDAVDTVAYLMRSAKRSVREGLRSVTASMVANLAIGQATLSRRLYPNGAEVPVSAVTALSEALGFDRSAAQIEQVVKRVTPKAAAGATLDEAIVSRWVHHVRRGEGATIVGSDADRALVAWATYPLLDLAHGTQRAPIVWPTEMFLFGDQPNTPAPDVAETAGPSRVIFYGPYLHLPPATYDVDATIWIGKRTQDIPFTIEMFAGKSLTMLRIEPQRPGNYRGSFSFTYDSPVDALEMRFCSAQGAIDGEVALREVRLQPRRDAGRPAEAGQAA